MIVFKNDPLIFIKRICDRFLYHLKKILLTIILTIVNEGSSLTMLTKRQTLSEQSFFEKNYMQLYIFLDIFLKTTQ